MNKLIITATIALVSTVAATSAFAGGCHDYSYDSSYSSDYQTTYTPTYSGGYSSYSGY